jgi:hypothetical protein
MAKRDRADFGDIAERNPTDWARSRSVAARRDESDFYEALGIVGEGPLIAYTDGTTRIWTETSAGE